MQKVRIVIMTGNKEYLRTMVEYFSRNDGFEVVGATDNGEEGLRLVRENGAEAVIIGTTLQNVDGLGVLEQLQAEQNDCIKICTGAFTEDSFLRRLHSKGADYYLVEPFSPEVAERRILDIQKERQFANELPEKTRKAIDEEISMIFISIGIPPHIKGYNYLREGIKMTVKQPSIINSVTKELYPKIGEKFDTSASKVERAIRHAIEVAWNRGRIDAISAIFGARVYLGTEKPTNSEFIALVADKLILEHL